MRNDSTTGPEREPVSDWRERGACVDQDPELFFPSGRTRAALEQTDRARAVCARCAVAGLCLSWALSTGEQFGIWGGTSPEDRRAIRRSRSAVSRQADAAAHMPAPIFTALVEERSA
jgi:WhiB family redox-sensing transcriptional regulator